MQSPIYVNFCDFPPHLAWSCWIALCLVPSHLNLANSSIRIAIKRSAVPAWRRSKPKCSCHQFASTASTLYAYIRYTACLRASLSLPVYIHVCTDALRMEMGPPVRQRAIKIKVIDSIWKCLTHDAGNGAGEGIWVCVVCCVHPRGGVGKKSEERSQLPLDGGCLRRAFQQALVIILSHVWLPRLLNKS